MRAIRHTAWVTTDPTCLSGNTADVVVLVDRIIGFSPRNEGDDVPAWSSMGEDVFEADTKVCYDGDHDLIIQGAEAALATGGWVLTGAKWEPVPTGYVRTVSPSATA